MSTSTVADWTGKKERWMKLVSDLCAEIYAWAGQREWNAHQESKTITEEHFDTYELPALIVGYPGGRLHVDPVAANIAGGEGRVDLLSYPTMNSLMLILKNGEWKVYTDSGVAWPEPWSKESFYQIVESLKG
jgi:hypothetical protein